MSFFLRKCFRLGPLRLNLSKGGPGASVGVSGARVGSSSRGRSYFYGGANGLYYREDLGSLSSAGLNASSGRRIGSRGGVYV